MIPLKSQPGRMASLGGGIILQMNRNINFVTLNRSNAAAAAASNAAQILGLLYEPVAA